MILALAALTVAFSLLDAATTYACLQRPWMAELNPIGRWLIDALGLEAGLALGTAARCALVAAVIALHKAWEEFRPWGCLILALWACASLAASVNNLLHLFLGPPPR